MKKYIPVLLIFALLLIVQGCVKNITVDLPPYQKKLVVFCVLYPDSIPKLYLSQSKAYFDYSDTAKGTDYIKNAEVIIGNETGSETLSLHSAFDSSLHRTTWFYQGKNKILPGKNYKLTINYNGKQVTAATTVPAIQQLQADTLKAINSYGFLGGLYYHFQISFKDIAGQENSYFMVVKALNSAIAFNQTSEFTDTRTDLLNMNTDEGIDGQEISIQNDFTPTLPVSIIDTFSVMAIVESPNKEAADYFNSIRKQGNANNDPFSEPVTLRSNIKNGLGIFGAVSPVMQQKMLLSR